MSRLRLWVSLRTWVQRLKTNEGTGGFATAFGASDRQAFAVFWLDSFWKHVSTVLCAGAQEVPGEVWNASSPIWPWSSARSDLEIKRASTRHSNNNLLRWRFKNSPGKAFKSIGLPTAYRPMYMYRCRPTPHPRFTLRYCLLLLSSCLVRRT